jgi:hypothetical protein
MEATVGFGSAQASDQEAEAGPIPRPLSSSGPMPGADSLRKQLEGVTLGLPATSKEPKEGEKAEGKEREKKTETETDKKRNKEKETEKEEERD